MRALLKSFIDIPESSDFPLENLLYGIFSKNKNSQRSICVALG